MNRTTLAVFSQFWVLFVEHWCLNLIKTQPWLLPFFVPGSLSDMNKTGWCVCLLLFIGEEWTDMNVPRVSQIQTKKVCLSHKYLIEQPYIANENIYSFLSPLAPLPRVTFKMFMKLTFWFAHLSTASLSLFLQADLFVFIISIVDHSTAKYWPIVWGKQQELFPYVALAGWLPMKRVCYASHCGSGSVGWCSKGELRTRMKGCCVKEQRDGC